MQPSRELSTLIDIMAALRDADTGCPWDLEQNFETIRHYTIEEAYEVADAIERGDYDDLREELGDLLLQPIYHAQMAKEQKMFDIGDVILSITTKLIRRHPHVFGSEDAKNAGAAKGQWEDVKALERAQKFKNKAKAVPASILDDVAFTLPALNRAEKLSRRAARVGFDWPEWQQVLAKCKEELSEVTSAVENNEGEVAVHEEIGDLLFSISNLARHLNVDPEAALRDANRKFTRRFSYVEKRCAQDNTETAQTPLTQLETYWNEIRAADKSI